MKSFLLALFVLLLNLTALLRPDLLPILNVLSALPCFIESVVKLVKSKTKKNDDDLDDNSDND